MAAIHYHNKQFKVLSNSSDGEVTAGLVFTYQQEGQVLSCNYAGGNIIKGHILGTVNAANGVLSFVYHQVNAQGEVMVGKCTSTPEVLANSKLRLHESWAWLLGKSGSGTSILEEI